MAISTEDPLILILKPLGSFQITTAELKRVTAHSQYMMIEGTVRSEHVEAGQESLRRLAERCEELIPSRLYARYANKKMFRHEKAFWTTSDATVKSHVKRMADKRIIEAVSLAHALDIPILYAKDEKTPLHITDRLQPDTDKEVTPVMRFSRHEGGTSYQLQLRIDGQIIERPCEHHLTVFTYDPGLLALDGHIYSLSGGFSGKLLLPFVGKAQTEIPRKMENEYFHRFILKHVAQAEINAEGFDITDANMLPTASLVAETTIHGKHILQLRFRYGSTIYTSDSKSNGRVTLTDKDGDFCFVRQMRDRQREQAILDILMQQAGAGPIIEFQSLSEMIGWLRQHAPKLKEQGIDVTQPSDHVYYIGPLSVEQSDTWNGDWLQTDVTVVCDNGRLRFPFLDLRETILSGEKEYLLPSGELLLIPQEWLQRYTSLLLMGTPRERGFQRHRSQITASDLVFDRLTSATGHPAMPPQAPAIDVQSPASLKATLRPYQLSGFQWLWGNFMAQTGCCLSDEMGLGKTLQTIALLLKYKEAAKAQKASAQPLPGMLFSEEEMQGCANQKACAEGQCPPYRTSLVVAPASVVHNWRNELARFAPSLSVMTYTGDATKRKDKRLALTQWDIVLTTYRTMLNDIEALARFQFGIIVFDESQAFKTATSQIHQAVTRLQALHRMALSGTPVENNLQELWSLMNVLAPQLLGDARTFQNAFVNPIANHMEDSRRTLLRQLIAPRFLKRTKEEVLNDLPERQDEVVHCQMTDEQASLYAIELSKARNEWLDPEASAQRRQIHMLSALQRLRQIANGEGKLSVVFEHLENLRQSLHKVLIFSEYVTLLNQVAKEMTRHDWPYAMLTGETTQREEVIARFQQSADCQFFLISLKAGGVGLNLTAADYVFLLDPWWNQAAEEQAIARAHRIGQKRSVFVYRFVAIGTLEEQILTLQNRKQTLIDSVMPFICNKENP